MKFKCKVCGKRFMPYKSETYLVREKLTGLAALSATEKIYDATDCPRCGSQYIMGIRIPNLREGETENEIESNA